MAGRKTFVGGDILLASELNGFLMDQSVMVFDNAGARTTAIPSPIEGMVTYLKDSNKLQVFTGASFVDVTPAPTGVLQIVSATDTNNRSTTSTSFVSANIAATITPKSATSKLLVSWNFNPRIDTTFAFNTRTVFFSIFNGSSDVVQRRYEIVATRSQDNLKLATGDQISTLTTHSNSPVTFTGRFRTDDDRYAAQAANTAGRTALLTIMEIL